VKRSENHAKLAKCLSHAPRFAFRIKVFRTLNDCMGDKTAVAVELLKRSFDYKRSGTHPIPSADNIADVQVGAMQSTIASLCAM
jgi:hypothetical protein